METLYEYYHQCKDAFPFKEVPDDEEQLRIVIDEMKCLEAEFRVLRQHYEARFRQIMWKKHRPPGY